jgi:xanthine dehydrogenase molybdenum-binding subunit
MPSIHLTVNGSPRAVDVHEDATLLEVLREGCGLTAAKDGCSPSGQCGCCTVLVDGQAKVACAMPAEKAANREVITLEGIDERERRIFARAFAVSAGAQCGFCIPGIVVRAHHILRKNRRPSREEIAQGLGAHLCRCTGYVKIVDAIELAARALDGEPVPDGDYSGKVGSSLPKYEAEELTLGERKYIDDLTAPGMLHGAVVLSAHPRARIRSIDLTAARALPGVRAIVGAADVPGQRYQGLIYPDWPIFVAVAEETRYTGDVIVAIAADTRQIARRAAELVAIDYEVLAPMTSPAEAMAPGAPLLHPENGHADNLLSTSRTRRGDADAALAGAAHVVSGSYRTQLIEHAFLEPESCLAVPRGATDVDGAVAQLLHVYSQGQGVYDDQRQICSALALPSEALRVTLVSCGGAFGGKEDLSIQAQTPLLALVTGKPVKLTIDRE